MITETGYSKDPMLMPEGIVVTFGRDMMDEQGGPIEFLRNFEWVMSNEEDYWMHKMSNLPTFRDFTHVYIIVMNRLYGRCIFGGIDKGITTAYAANGESKRIDWNRIILAGPLEKAPFKRTLKGFQGFRYCTKLF